MDEQRNVRRRGDELLESLFEATIRLMNEVRHTNLTFQQIAEAAKTSRTVLYRRWATTFDLLQDIYSYKARKLFEGAFWDKIEDTGSLRSDLIQLLTLYQNIYSEIGAEILNNYFYIKTQNKEKNEESAANPNEIDKNAQTIKKILKNAQSRGEKIKRVDNITLMLPFDLIRMENLIRPGEIDKKRLETMVDEILLPVFKE